METFWVWLIVGVLFLLSELVVGGFFICFFGIGALCVGALDFFLPEVSTPWWMLVWAVVSIVLFALCRHFFPQVFRGGARDDEKNSDIETDGVTGAVALVTAEIKPGVPGKVEFRGSVWEAQAENAISVGTKVKIVKRENITLNVKEL